VAVARLSPIADRPAGRPLTAEQDQALQNLIATALASEVPPDAEPARFDRDELYLERFERPRHGE